MGYGLTLARMITQEDLNNFSELLKSAGLPQLLGGETLSQFKSRLESYRRELELTAHTSPSGMRISRSDVQMMNLMIVELALFIMRLRNESAERDSVLSGMTPQQRQLMARIPTSQ